MKENKVVMFTLIIVVIAIWGYIVYMIIKHYSKEVGPTRIDKKDSAINMIVADTAEFKLNPGYADPFLKNERIPIQKGKAKVTKSSINKIDTSWLENLKYLGCIKSNEYKLVALIKRNETTLTLKKGDSINNFVVYKINEKYIEFKYKNNILSKSISKNTLP